MSMYRIYKYPLKGDCYKHIYFKRGRVLGRSQLKEGKERTECLQKLDENLIRARRMVRDYILCNPFDYFTTFTFDGGLIDRYNLRLCQKVLVRFFSNYRNRYSPDFRYIVIPEFHEDGAVHFHGMVRGIRWQDFEVPLYIPKRNKLTDKLEMVPNTKGYVRWKNYNLGFFSCSRVKCYEACAMYVSKYITKDLMKLPKGQRVFFKSENLKKPELVFDSDDVPIPFNLGKKDFVDDFVVIHHSRSAYGMLPDWYGEQCADLGDPLSDDFSTDLFEAITGEQIAI